MKKSAWERKLSQGVDSMVGEAQEAYGLKLDEMSKDERKAILGSRLKEELEIDRRMGDVKLRDDVIELAREIVRLRKLSERFSDEQSLVVSYRVVVDINEANVSFRACVQDAKHA